MEAMLYQIWKSEKSIKVEEKRHHRMMSYSHIQSSFFLTCAYISLRRGIVCLFGQIQTNRAKSTENQARPRHPL